MTLETREGIREDIVREGAELSGKRVRLTIFDGGTSQSKPREPTGPNHWITSSQDVSVG